MLETLEELHSQLAPPLMSDVLVAKESLMHEIRLIDDLLDVARIVKVATSGP